MSVGIVAFISFNSFSLQRVLALIILMLFILCSASLYFGCATHTFTLFIGDEVLTCDLYAFELVHMSFYLK